MNFDLSSKAGIDALEDDLNRAEPKLRAIEASLGLPWGLEIGRRRDLIRSRRLGICTWCEKEPDKSGPQPWRCKCGREVYQV